AGEAGDAAGAGVYGVPIARLDVGEFFDALEEALRADLAEAAGYGAEGGECVAQEEAYHCVVVCARFELMPQETVAFRAVEVVGVDDGEGLVDCIGGHENGVGGAPGFG